MSRKCILPPLPRTAITKMLLFFSQQLTSIKEQTIAQIQGFLPDLTQAQQDAIVSAIDTMIETEIQILA